MGNPKLDLKNLSHSVINSRKANKVKSSYFVCLMQWANIRFLVFDPIKQNDIWFVISRFFIISRNVHIICLLRFLNNLRSYIMMSSLFYCVLEVCTCLLSSSVTSASSKVKCNVCGSIF